tara:strand:- start:1054 stop:1692 length:639 start_codon:yes stop_codon:yes gene_type:complete
MTKEIFKIFKIPIKINYSFFIAFFAVFLSSFYTAGIVTALWASVLFFILFASVLLHELGHAFAAKKFDIGTRNITLYIFGGTAYLERLPKDPKVEIIISLAGPAVNLAILMLSIPFVILGVPLALEVAILNIIMGVFNLFPAFPMDGGRVLRALLAMVVEYKKATVIAINISIISAFIFFILAIKYKIISILIVSIFLLITTNAERIRVKAS